MQNIIKKKYISWVNVLKAFCMLFVYVDHAELYYGSKLISYGPIFKPFYVNAFFFVSGYLFFKKQFRHIDNYNFVNFEKNLQNVIFRLVIPTIVFATIMYVPKLLFHDKDISIVQYVYDVFGGISFWFTSSIVVAQIILLKFPTP